MGVTGHLYSSDNTRGIYKTTDGGVSWTQTLSLEDPVGIIEISVAPENFGVQYAAAWEKDRKAWNFVGSGTSSGIYKSTDAGTTWKRIATENSGFPQGEGVGRIGLAAYDAKTIYAIVDNQDSRPSDRKEVLSLTKQDFETCLLYTSPSPRDKRQSRMPSSA